MRILIVEDETRLADALAAILMEHKIMVDRVASGDAGVAYGESGAYDLILLDVMLPGLNGFQVAQTLREKKINTPILMLTALDNVREKVMGLNAGADDYMTKPFSPEELLARIRVLTRRRGEVILDKLSFEDVTFHISTSELACDTTARSVRLNHKEAELMQLFLRQPNCILHKDQLIIKVWGYDSGADDNNLEAYISFLRKKLVFLGTRCALVSVKKMGYKLEVTEC